ncbi:rhomboid family intramembrane serine protease [Arenicella xantha]|uniref:Rhomboid family protein n=1 Tax=Arenicella xantha TaxID=644221 RepID=A0A395JKM3_9GAMM|nr:rhomboid family intramembrane serine protease [Arenicella xantha]RBP49602.1 rhomboid family protein [Arenicella xantha]
MSYAALFHSIDSAKCQEFNLVLQATGFDSHLVHSGSRYYLLIDHERAEQAYQQLRLYLSENAEEEVLAKPLHPISKGFLGAYLYGLALLIVGAFSSLKLFGQNWQNQGVAHSEKIFDGEWWRTITALTLHADAAHLIGNIGFGALFGILVSQYIGSGAAWFSILIAGALGNALNAYLYQTLHLSIGASTMVFAALGILGVFALNDRYAYAQRGLRRWAPLIATLALLGFLGTTGERTDVMAHLTGYFSGCMTALVWMTVLRRMESTVPAQGVFATLSLVIVVLAWALALT